MAEGGQMDSLLDCSVCLESLTTPICLPCGHTFCLQCVTDHAHTFRGDPVNDETFNCPTCRQTVAIPDEGIGKLPRNYLAERMKEKNTSTKIACGVCREWNQSEAASWRCYRCDLILCGKCKQVHSTDTSIAHQIEEIVTIESSVHLSKSEKLKNCHIHPGEVYRFFCKGCKVPLCRDCVMREHQGHGLEDIHKVANRARQDLTAAMNDKQSDIQNHDAMIAEIKKTRDTIKHNTDKEIMKTREHTQLLLDKIKHKSTTVERDIKDTGDASIFILQTHLDKLLKSRADLQNDLKKIDEAIKLTYYTDSLNTSLRITKNTPHRPSKSNEVILDKPQKCLEFSGKDTDCLNLDKAFKTLDRKVSLCKLEFQNKFGKHVTGHTLMAPPISHKPRVVTSFDARRWPPCPVALTSCGQVVSPTRDGRLVFYNKDGTTQTKSLLNKDRSQFQVSWWLPSDIDVADDDSLLIVTFDSHGGVGGVYLFNKEGVLTGVMKMDFAHAAAYVADGKVAVRRGFRGDDYLEIWKLTGATGLKIELKTDRAVGLAVNKVTHDIIVTHRTYVTAFMYPDLSVQWTYRGEGDGVLTDASDVCVDGWGRVMIADYGRRRVIVLSREGEYITHFNTDYFMENDAPVRLAVRGKDELVVSGSDDVYVAWKIYILSIVDKKS